MKKKDKVLCKINCVSYTPKELVKFLSNNDTSNLHIETKLDFTEFFKLFGIYAYENSGHKFPDMEDDDFFTMIGRITIDHYIPSDYRMTYKSSYGFIHTLVKKAVD